MGRKKPKVFKTLRFQEKGLVVDLVFDADAGKFRAQVTPLIGFETDTVRELKERVNQAAEDYAAFEWRREIWVELLDPHAREEQSYSWTQGQAPNYDYPSVGFTARRLLVADYPTALRQQDRWKGYVLVRDWDSQDPNANDKDARAVARRYASGYTTSSTFKAGLGPGWR